VRDVAVESERSGPEQLDARMIGDSGCSLWS
jgi:hypothetical protein